jgi:hypothetical protein
MYICAYNVSQLDSPSIILPHPLPFLRTISQISLFYFHVSIQSTLTISALLHPLHLPSPCPLVPILTQDLFYLPGLHFLKYILIVQEGFASWVPVAHTYNPSYSGGRNQEDHGLRTAWAKSSRDPILKIPNNRKDWQSGSSGRALA